MNKLNFEDSMNRINEIVILLERNEVPLEEAISLFEEGLKLVKECDGILKGFETKVSALMTDYQGNDDELA